jgi:hypothetical protein
VSVDLELAAPETVYRVLSEDGSELVSDPPEISDADVVAVMAEGRRRVKERFGIELEPEVQALGPVQFPRDWARDER